MTDTGNGFKSEIGVDISLHRNSNLRADSSTHTAKYFTVSEKKHCLLLHYLGKPEQVK